MTGRLRCENGEWKHRGGFSNKQLRKYDLNACSGSATPSKTGIRCIEHSIKPTVEEKCRGPCGRWREKRLFSKSTIRKGIYVSSLTIIKPKLDFVSHSGHSGVSIASIGRSEPRMARHCPLLVVSCRWKKRTAFRSGWLTCSTKLRATTRHSVMMR